MKHRLSHRSPGGGEDALPGLPSRDPEKRPGGPATWLRALVSHQPGGCFLPSLSLHFCFHIIAEVNVAVYKERVFIVYPIRPAQLSGFNVTDILEQAPGRSPCVGFTATVIIFMPPLGLPSSHSLALSSPSPIIIMVLSDPTSFLTGQMSGAASARARHSQIPTPEAEDLIYRDELLSLSFSLCSQDRVATLASICTSILPGRSEPQPPGRHTLAKPPYRGIS